MFLHVSIGVCLCETYKIKCLFSLFQPSFWGFELKPSCSTYTGQHGRGFCLSHHNTFCISIMIERSTQMLYILAAHLQAGWCSGRRFRPVTTQQVRWTDGEGCAQNSVFAGHRPGRRQMPRCPSPGVKWWPQTSLCWFFYFFLGPNLHAVSHSETPSVIDHLIMIRTQAICYSGQIA